MYIFKLEQASLQIKYFVYICVMRRRKRKIYVTQDLDLHGIKHQDAAIMVEDHILISKPPFKIITGHSNTMKSITRSILDKHQYKYQDGVLNNLGVILVVSE